MKIIVGLGNPGQEYLKTRHNAGFWVLDKLASEHNVEWKKSRTHKAEISSFIINKEKILLVKPCTFMNLSGQSLVSLIQYYKLLPQNILIVHDELDLEPGCFTFTLGGGSAGHNGIKSIYDLSKQKFLRLRIGIGRPSKPGPSLKEWVLKAPNITDSKVIKKAVKDSTHAIMDWITFGASEAMNRWNSHKHLPITNNAIIHEKK